MIKSLLYMLGALAVAGCAAGTHSTATQSLNGQITNNEYVSAKGGFSCPVPTYPLAHKVTDGVDRNGETATFHLFVKRYRVDYFLIDAHPIASVDHSRPLRDQLNRVKNAYVEAVIKPTFSYFHEVKSKESVIADRESLLVILKYPLPPPNDGIEHRGLLIFRNRTHVAVIHHTPALAFRDDLGMLEQEIQTFTARCRFVERAAG